MYEQLQDAIVKLQEQERNQSIEYQKDLSTLRQNIQNVRARIAQSKQLSAQLLASKASELKEATDKFRSIVDEDEKRLQHLTLPKIHSVEGLFMNKFKIPVPHFENVPQIKEINTKSEERMKEVEAKLKKELQEMEIKHNLYELRYKQMAHAEESVPKHLMKKRDIK